MFTVQDVVTKIHALETGQDPDNVGRFAATGNLRNDNLAAGLLYDNVGGMPSSLAEAWETTKGIIGNRQDGWDRFKAQVFSLFNFRARENPGLSALERLLSEARGLSMQIKNALNEKLAVVTNLAVADVTAGMPGLGGITQDQLAQTNKLLYDAQRYAASRLKKLSDLGRTPLFVINPERWPRTQSAGDRPPLRAGEDHVRASPRRLHLRGPLPGRGRQGGCRDGADPGHPGAHQGQHRVEGLREHPRSHA
jgi:hypothetical protein